jgi:phosphoglycerate dehydrogenase-like enzyme
VENWPVAELRQREIVLTNAAGVFAIPISEWVLAALLMIAKRAHAMHDAQREHRWANELDLDELCDKTLLILGTGGIGREIAKRAAAFGMRIWGSSRSGAPVEHVERVVTGSAWHELLPEADYVVSTLPLTPETRGMFGATELRRMKPSAWLLNVGRGATVDEPALLAALHDGTIGGAAIDAWVEEPLPPDHPAWTTPNLIIWPHHSGSSPENTRRGLDLFADNVRRFVRGEELLNVVDLEAGY